MIRKLRKVYSKFDLKTNIERILEILDKVKENCQDGIQIQDLNWLINIYQNFTYK